MFAGEGTEQRNSHGRYVWLCTDECVFRAVLSPVAVEGLGAKRSIFRGGVEAGTLLAPLLRLNDAVTVQVGTEVAMAADGAFGVQNEQLPDEEAQRFALLRCTCIGGGPVGLQTAFVGNADAVGIEAPHMGADSIERAHREYGAFPGDVEVIAAGGETPLPVEAVEAFRGKLAVAPGSGAVHYDKVDVSVTVQTERRQIGGRHCGSGGCNGLGNDSGLCHERAEGWGYCIKV